MAQDDYNFPEDEFDLLGRDRTPQAVHRAPRPWWRVWGPLIAVVVIAPLIAFGLVQLATRDSTPAPEATPAATEVATDPGTGEAPTQGEATEAPPEEEPTVEETTPEPPPLDQSVPVRVLNGAGISGLAGNVTETVEAAGWSAVEPGNYTSRDPDVSTIYYNNPELLPQAQALGTLLGIEPLTEYADVDSITVVLRGDFSQ